MSTFSLNSSHVGSLPKSNQYQTWSRKPSDQLSKRSALSTGTVQRQTDRKVSAASIGSAGSKSAGPLRVVNENIPPSSRSTSYASLTPYNKTDSPSGSRIQLQGYASVSTHGSAISLSPGHSKPASSLFVIDGTFQDVDLNKLGARSGGIGIGNEKEIPAFEHAIGLNQEFPFNSAPRRLSVVGIQNDQPGRGDSSLSGKWTESAQIVSRTHSSTEDSETGTNPFRRLMDGLRPQHPKKKGQLTARRERWSLDDFEDDKTGKSAFLKPPKFVSHRKASSWSSGGALTFARAGGQNGIALPEGSERASKSRFLKRSNRSSKVSEATQRGSTDASIDIPCIIDEMAHHRAVQRRKILEEIHSSEEGYINDLKILAHVYLTILSSSPHFPRDLQNEVVRNLNDMLVLHEEILIQFKLFLRDPRPKRSHHRWNSGDGNSKCPEIGRNGSRKSRRSLESLWSRHPNTMMPTATPNEAADIVRIFGGMLPRFYTYEEYGGRYESMLQLLATTSKSIPSWDSFERGIEALMNSLLPKDQIEEGKKKGLTLEDLLIKPLQRVCRYPLLFTELLKNTPAIDDKESETMIQKTLGHFVTAAQEINDATNDPQVRARIHRSWQLQSLLRCPRELDSVDVLRSLGHVRLCGLLYVVYHAQPNETPRGRYMFCALFSAHLLFALPDAASKTFLVQIILDASQFRLDSATDSQGLQCRGAHCWKLVFTMYQQIHEMILCACSDLEESQWKAEMTRVSEKFRDSTSLPGMVFLDLKIKSLGIGNLGRCSRRSSAQGHSRSPLRNKGDQVIFISPANVKEEPESPRSISSSLKRSKSVQSPSQIPVLAPDKSERARLETAMDGVWTKEVLPFPGIMPQRSGNFIRTSRNNVIRKLSKASTLTQSSQSISITNIEDPFVDSSAGHSHSIKTSKQSNDMSSTASRSRAKSAGLTTITDDEPRAGALKNVTFNATRGRGVSDAALVTSEREEEKENPVGRKGKASRALLKAFSSDGVKKRLK